MDAVRVEKIARRREVDFVAIVVGPKRERL